MIDPWMEHLKKFDLFELHQEAQKIGYRVRVADGAIFDLEYEGGYQVCYNLKRGLRRFNDTNQGRQEARGFLIAMKQLQEVIRPYAWLVGGRLFCENPYGDAPPLTKQGTIDALKHGDFPNECAACGQPLVPLSELE